MKTADYRLFNTDMLSSLSVQCRRVERFLCSKEDAPVATSSAACLAGERPDAELTMCIVVSRNSHIILPLAVPSGLFRMDPSALNSDSELTLSKASSKTTEQMVKLPALLLLLRQPSSFHPGQFEPAFHSWVAVSCVVSRYGARSAVLTGL